MSADELKAKGNAAFQNGQYEEAIKFFTEAIEVDPSNHVFFSNRSAAQASLRNYQEALEDAQQVVKLKPDWPKGYSRLGAAHCGLEQFDEALEAYDKGLELDPNNAQLKEGKEATQAQQRQQGRRNPFGANVEQMMARLMADPETKEMASDPTFMQTFAAMMKNPQMMLMAMQDPKMKKAFSVATGINLEFAPPGTAGPSETAGAPDDSAYEGDGNIQPDSAGGHSRSFPSSNQPASHHPPPEPELTEEEKEEAKAKAAALEAKTQGNSAYKARKFEEAIEHYNKALELYDKDITFLTNRAAVYFEMGEYDKCVKDCEEAYDRGRELHVDYALLAKALTRKGTALQKSGDLESAIATYQKALTEHRTADTLNKLKAAEKELKVATEKAYIDLDLCNKAREEGNKAFEEQHYPEAVKHYQEALKRGPPEVNPDAYKLYSNLAATYTKLAAFNEGLKAAEKCIELKPEFPKGYSRKGHIQFYMKEFEKAQKTYQAGLEHDPENQELKEGVSRCQQELFKFMVGDVSQQDLKERQARALQDPEIQNILTDPTVQLALQSVQEDPKAFSQYMRNPDMSSKLQRLMAAGVLQVASGR